MHVIAPSFCSSDTQSSAAGFIFSFLLCFSLASKWSSGKSKLCVSKYPTPVEIFKSYIMKSQSNSRIFYL